MRVSTVSSYAKTGFDEFTPCPDLMLENKLWWLAADGWLVGETSGDIFDPDTIVKSGARALDCITLMLSQKLSSM